jgi:16S rRNA (guanine527-N7)-methyltransferase
LPRAADDLPAIGDEFWSTLEAGLAELALELSNAERAAIDAHVRLLLAWNAHINLTAVRDAAGIARAHVLDTLLAIPVLRRLSRGAPPSVLDLGSGAGYPGLPLAVVLPARRTVLVDSITKKAAFLEVVAAAAVEAQRRAGIEAGEITALAERAEDLAEEPEQRDRWDIVVARAVGSVAEVAELGLPLARRRGHVAIWKRDAGDGALQREIGRATRVVQAAGGGPPRLMSLEGADRVGLGGHCLVVITKQRPTPDRYPRPAGERRRRALT